MPHSRQAAPAIRVAASQFILASLQSKEIMMGFWNPGGMPHSRQAAPEIKLVASQATDMVLNGVGVGKFAEEFNCRRVVSCGGINFITKTAKVNHLAAHLDISFPFFLLFGPTNSLELR